jgi:hypothetical protein
MNTFERENEVTESFEMVPCIGVMSIESSSSGLSVKIYGIHVSNTK